MSAHAAALLEGVQIGMTQAGRGMRAELGAPHPRTGGAEVVQEFRERGAERDEAHAAV